MTGGAAALERPLAALVMRRVAVDKKSRLRRSGVRCKRDFLSSPHARGDVFPVGRGA